MSENSVVGLPTAASVANYGHLKMLTKIFTTAMLCTVLQAQAQEITQKQKAVQCAKNTTVTAVLQEYAETLLWASKLESSNIALFVNQQTKTWTLVQWTDQVACVLDTGTNYLLRWPGKTA